MRTSQKVFLSGLVVLLALVTLGIAGLRTVVGEFLGEEARAGSLVFERQNLDLSADLSGFDRILIRSAWEVEIVPGADWAVDVSVPDDTEPYVRVGVADGRLVLDIDRSERPWWSRRTDASNQARVTMPALAGVEVQGAASVILGDFSGDSLDLRIAGAANVESGGGRFDSLRVRIGGAGNVELTRTPVTDAEVELSGASNVELRMDGGELVGTMAGFGRLQYAGDVSREDVEASGFSVVERMR